MCLIGCNNVAPLYAWEENTVKLRMMLHQEIICSKEARQKHLVQNDVWTFPFMNFNLKSIEMFAVLASWAMVAANSPVYVWD